MKLSFTLTPIPKLLANWMVMVVAMTAPLVASAVARQRRADLRIGRRFALSVAYLAFWLVAGLLMPLAVNVAHSLARAVHVPDVLIGFALALAWQATPWKQRALNLCHAELPRRASQADLLQVSILRGMGCVGACGPGMLAAMLTSAGSLTVMALVTVLLFLERQAPTKPAAWCWPSINVVSRRPAF